jgi:hypothetical protein
LRRVNEICVPSPEQTRPPDVTIDVASAEERSTVTSEPRVRLTRVRDEPGLGGTWQVVGQPFRVVPMRRDWLVVGVGSDARGLLFRHGLLGARFPTRGATVRALGGALAAEPRRRAAALARASRVRR